MRRTIYVLLFWLFMEYTACFGGFAQNALAAPQITNVHNAITSPEEMMFNQHAYEEHTALIKQQLNKNVHSSENYMRKTFQSNFLQNIHTSSRHGFGFPWPPLKALDISSLWKQQHDKQKKKDVYDYGE